MAEQDRSSEATSRTLTELNEELAQSEQRYREIFENSPAGIVLFEVVPGGRFRVLGANPVVGRMTGIPADRAAGRFVEELVPPSTAKALNAMYLRCLEAGVPITAENTLDFPAGRRTYYTTVVPLRDSRGLVHRMFAMPTDVTEQRRVEEALRDSEQRYREVFESTSDGIFIVEVTAEQRYRLLDMNPAQARMLGVEAAAVRGRFLEEYTSLEVADSLREDNRAAIQAGHPLTFERTLDLPEGRRWFSTILIPVTGTDGITRRMIGVARDITETHRAAEREREQEQRLFQAAKLVSLGTLVSGIAHEINNPNNFIRLNSQNLGELWQDLRSILDRAAAAEGGLTMHGIPYETARGMIERLIGGIEEGSKRIEKLLVNLRDYARGDAGQLTDRVDLNDVIGSAVVLLGDLISKSTVSFQTRLEASLPAVRGNYHQLEQVVINLVTNACQSLRTPQGSVVVATSVSPSDQAVCLEVTDEGVGIRAADLERITDPFFTTKRAQGGSGLGLAVSSRIVANHGGTMRFTSSEGTGTTVRVHLPRHPEVWPAGSAGGTP
ncbi:MAG TPA: PAS domain-containing protein [Spirochaetia bacterium]|nr:PAS domain-containing protein [Spirochaetia bacterium]